MKSRSQSSNMPVEQKQTGNRKIAELEAVLEKLSSVSDCISREVDLVEHRFDSALRQAKCEESSSSTPPPESFDQTALGSYIYRIVLRLDSALSRLEDVRSRCELPEMPEKKG